MKYPAAEILKQQIPLLDYVEGQDWKPVRISRAAAASPQLESGNWYLPHPMLASWVEEFIGECAAFPAGAFDDCVDAWSQGAKRLLTAKARPVRRVVPERIYQGERSWMV